MNDNPVNSNNNHPNYQDRIINRLGELHKLHAQKSEPSLIKNVIQKIFSALREWRRTTPFVIFTKEHNLTLLTQQNTVVKGEGRGSMYYTQKELFRNMLSKMVTTKTEVSKLLKNITDMHSNDVDFIRSFFVGNDKITDEIYQQYRNLEPGESMWMDLSSIKGFHGMKGRITKNTDHNYTFQMSNTGAGIETYNWHNEVDNAHVQTVIEWKDRKEIPYCFFRDIVNATLNGTMPPAQRGSDPFSLTIKKEGQNYEGDENMKAIDAVYGTLEKWLGNPTAIPYTSNSPYWSLPQEGPSCIPQSIWALLRVSQTSENTQS